MANIFNSIRLKRPRRNAFNLSYESKLTLNMGELVPIMCMPVVPGDKFRVKTESLVRLAPLVAPMMHRVNVFTHYFFVPNRLVWNQWEDFITKGVDGEDVPVFPKLGISAASANIVKDHLGDSSLWDYLGLPSIAKIGSTVVTNSPNGVNLPATGLEVSALPFRAYNLIYNEYYRDQNLTNPIEFSLDGGVQVPTVDFMRLKRRAWEKDYFTSALPWLQRGPEVTVPIQGSGTDLDVVYENTSGGQKQRVAIAGVVAMEPKCIVFDEPTAMLDPNGRKEVIATAHDLNKKKGVTIILITHYMEEVVDADYVYVMEKGKIVMDGTPRDIFSRVDELKEHRLDVPQATLVADELRSAGVPIPQGILTRKELVDAIMSVANA